MGSGGSMKDKVIGAWALESFLIETPQGETRNWGINAQGLLLYTDTGHMSVSINKDVENKSTVEAQNFFDSILFYSGIYFVDGTTIKHKVGWSFRGPITRQARKILFSKFNFQIRVDSLGKILSF